MSGLLVKICGMRRQIDLDCASSLGVNFCGFIFHRKSPRFISPEKCAALNSHSMRRVGVFTTHDVTEIKRVMNLARLHMAQLHGDQDARVAASIGAERVIRVLWPDRCHDISELASEAEKQADSCAYFLLDAGAGGGGSGQTIDWNFSWSLELPRPWFLAGGLNAINANKAASICRPAGLDFNSGLEDAPGVKNHRLMRQALANCGLAMFKR